jgi:hypothetical protein
MDDRLLDAMLQRKLINEPVVTSFITLENTRSGPTAIFDTYSVLYRP